MSASEVLGVRAIQIFFFFFFFSYYSLLCTTIKVLFLYFFTNCVHRFKIMWAILLWLFATFRPTHIKGIDWTGLDHLHCWRSTALFSIVRVPVPFLCILRPMIPSSLWCRLSIAFLNDLVVSYHWSSHEGPPCTGCPLSPCVQKTAISVVGCPSESCRGLLWYV